MLKKNKPQQPILGMSAVFLLRFFNKIKTYMLQNLWYQQDNSNFDIVI